MKKISIKIPVDLNRPNRNEWKTILVEKEALLELLKDKKRKEKKTILNDRVFPVKKEMV